MFLHHASQHASQRRKKNKFATLTVIIITGFKETRIEIRKQMNSERITICWDKFCYDLVNYHKNTIYTMISIRVSESQIQEHSKFLFTFSYISILLYNQVFFFFSPFLSLSFSLEIGCSTKKSQIFRINSKSISVCRNILNNLSKAEKQLAQQRWDCTVILQKIQAYLKC